MANGSCLIAIKNKYSSLTEAEKRIADQILKDGNEVINMTASELAQRAKTAKSAVVRCCKSLGFDGFSSLKLSLASELSKNRQLNYIPYIYPNDTNDDILNKIFTANVKTLHDTLEMLDRRAFNKAVEILERANSVYVYGVGTSSAIVTDFQYRMMQLGKTAFYFTDVASMKISSMNIKKGDAAVGISHSGRTMATVDALSLAKDAGAETICITSCPESKITKVCDCSLEIYSDEIRYPIEAICARIAHISLIDALAVALSSKNYGEAAKRAKISHEIVNTVRYGEENKK